jgi:hypothetical protein
MTKRPMRRSGFLRQLDKEPYGFAKVGRLTLEEMSRVVDEFVKFQQIQADKGDTNA